MAKKPVRPSKLKIDERAFAKARGETNEQVFRRVAAEIRKFSFYGRLDLIQQVAQHPNLPAELTPLYGEERRFHGIKLKQSDISSRHYATWILAIFKKHEKILKKFLNCRKDVNAQILRGDGIAAMHILSKISQDCENWWSIETGIHVTKELLGSDTKVLVNNIRERYPYLNITIIAGDLALLSESSASFYSLKVLGRIKEYKKADVDGSLIYGDLESLSLLPLFYDPDRSPTIDILHGYLDWSIVDQYMLFRTIIMESVDPQELLGDVFDRVKELATILDDQELKNILNPCDIKNKFVDLIVEKYTRGDYEDVVRLVTDSVLAGSNEVLGLIEIFARAKIYSGAIVSTTFYDKIADELGKILVLDAKSTERIEYLYSLSVKFRKEAWAKSLLYHLVAIQRHKIHPKLLEVVRKQTQCLGEINTPKAKFSNFDASEVIENFLESTPSYRLIKHHKGDISGFVESDIFPIYSDFLHIQSELFLKENLFWKATEFYIDEYLKKRAAFDHLPFYSCCKEIELMVRDEEFNYLAAVVLLDICDLESESGFDELRTEIFLEYLDNKNVHIPSKMFSGASLSPSQIYFLEKICLPTQLDNIIQFQSYDEVIHERVAIIDILLNARVAGIEKLTAERDKVLETLFSEKLRAKIEAGKLYVDAQALQTQRRHVYLDLYERARSLGSDFVWEPIDSVENILLHGSSAALTDTELAKASGEKSTILVTLFMTLAYDFALNQKYGLDKYLSAEVRHQIFIPQLRSCFEKNRLVTVQKYGEYIENSFWQNEYDYVSLDIIERLDEILRGFSKKIDEVLIRVNDCFKVSLSGGSENQLFDFSPTSERFSRLADIVNKSSNFEKFFGNLISFMLELAVEGARSAQQLINDTLMPEILNIIDELECEINNFKGNAPLSDLMQAIRSARSDFTKEIEVVLLWFRFVGSENLQTFEGLGTVIEAAVSSFRSIFEHKGKKLSYYSSKSDLILNYREARSLFISLFTALENALRYGSSETEVIIRHMVAQERDVLTISNKTSIKIAEPESFLNLRREEWKVEFSPLSNQEGGTGLYKINSLLTGASPGFLFDISISDFNFDAIIYLNHGYFNNRRQSA